MKRCTVIHRSGHIPTFPGAFVSGELRRDISQHAKLELWPLVELPPDDHNTEKVENPCRAQPWLEKAGN